MACIRTVEILVPDRITTVQVEVPGRIRLVEVQIPGIPGPPGSGGVSFVKIAAAAISGHRVVRAVNASQIAVASADDLSHANTILGITTNAAALGGNCNVVNQGFVTESSWAFVAGQNVFIGLNGALTQSPSVYPASLYQRVIGIAVSPDTIFVDLGAVVELI